MRQLKCKSICDAILFSLLSAALAMLGHRAALAQAPFYQGKTITLIAGAGPGGMGDLRARALASALAKNIPGNPTITFQYMPGGGGRKAANHLYNSARRRAHYVPDLQQHRALCGSRRVRRSVRC